MMDFEAIDEAGRLSAGILLELVERLSPYDPADLLADVAALQLLPENADRAIRLEAFAHAAASLDKESSKPSISLHRLKQITNAEPLGQGAVASHEDPCDNAFTEAFTFHGGMFIVFPGHVDDSTFILRHLSTALFLYPEPFSNSDFVSKAYALLAAVLVLSNETALRAGLGRGVMPIFRGRTGDVMIPDSRRLTRLKQAISFSRAELDHLLTERHLPTTALDQLTVSLGKVSITDYQIDRGDLQTHPIVLAGDQLIVAIPGMLLVAARHELIRLAFEHHVEGELAKRYHAIVWNTVAESLGYLGNKALQLSRPDPPGIPCCQGAFFNMDTDKLIYAILVTDSLERYNLNSAFGKWPFQQVKSELIEHIQAVEEAAFNMPSPPNDVLFLILIQQIGRAVFWNYGGLEILPSSLKLSFAAAELQTIAFIEAGEPLSLWKFARMSWQVREKAHLIAVGELNEFFLYRKNGYSYYIPGLEYPAIIDILPGGAGELHQEVLRQYDWHAVQSYLPNFVIDVITLYGTRAIPIYVPLSHPGRQAACLVEGLLLPVWITGLAPEDEQQSLSDLYALFAHAIAYWLWQCTPSLRSPIQSLIPNHSNILVQLSLLPDEFWYRAEEQGMPANKTPIDLHVDSANSVISLTLRSSSRSLFATADNSGERRLMQLILSGLRELLPISRQDELSDSAIGQILDRHAPLGMKKMLVYFNVNTEPDLDPRGLPPYRKVQEADENELLDELGDYLRAVEHLEPRSIPEDLRTVVLSKAVLFYYRKLVDLVASLNPENLLEFLIAYQEAITRESSFRELTIPTQIACFSSETEMVHRLSEELPERANAATASRFVIEYVAACPPQGERPISLSVYDRLQALASLIIRFGFTSDLIHFQLANINLAMLPSGRLNVDREQYEKARANYFPNLAVSEIRRATEAFAHHWQENESHAEDTEMWSKLDAAAQVEFGCSLSDLQRFAVGAFTISEDLDPASAHLELSDFVDRLVKELGWSREQISHVLGLLTLIPIPDLLNPPPPYRKEDTYPWRNNRLLSYIRRPFVYRKRGETIEILWGNRHLYKAVLYLIHFCLAGRLQAQSSEMRKIMGSILHQQGEAFNDTVADVLERNPDLTVRTRVEKIGKLKVPGDIDVLVADPKKRRLGVLECKDFAAARMPHEMDYELKKLFQGKHGEKSMIEKRTDWVHMHKEEILAWLRLDGAGRASRWRVEPLIVVSQELLSPYLRKSPIRVVSLAQLTREQIW